MAEQSRAQDSGAGTTDVSGSQDRVKCREISIQIISGLRVAGKHWGSKSAPIKVLCLHGYVTSPLCLVHLLTRIQLAG